MGSHAPVEIPSTLTSPEVGASRRLIIFMVVVLPEPLRPRSTSVSPRAIVRLRSARSFFPSPISKLTFSNSIVGRFSVIDHCLLRSHPVPVSYILFGYGNRAAAVDPCAASEGPLENRSGWYLDPGWLPG